MTGRLGKGSTTFVSAVNLHISGLDISDPLSGGNHQLVHGALVKNLNMGKMFTSNMKFVPIVSIFIDFSGWRFFTDCFKFSHPNSRKMNPF